MSIAECYGMYREWKVLADLDSGSEDLANYGKFANAMDELRKLLGQIRPGRLHDLAIDQLRGLTLGR